MPKRSLSEIDRFWLKVNKDGPVQSDLGACWLWTAGLARGGYGKFRINGRTGVAHVFAYTMLVGPIPEGLQLDHLCHSRSIAWCERVEDCLHRRCVNPAHLEPVTAKENINRSVHRGGRRNSDMCWNGRHPWTPENRTKNGMQCRLCVNERMLEYKREWRARTGRAG